MVAPTSGATFVIARLGRINRVDDAACALLGYSRAELLAMHGSELVLPEDRPAVAVSLERMRGGELHERRGRLVRKDGSPIRVLVHPRRLAEGRLVLTVTALRDESGSMESPR
jgi:PAS domain S-box-containing protein